MLPLVNRLAHQVGRGAFRPSFTAARLAHTKRVLYSEPATHRTTTQAFSSNVDQQADLIGQRPQEEKPLDVSPCVDNISINSRADPGPTVSPMSVVKHWQHRLLRSSEFLTSRVSPRPKRKEWLESVPAISKHRAGRWPPSLSLIKGKPVRYFFRSLVDAHLPIFQLK